MAAVVALEPGVIRRTADHRLTLGEAERRPLLPPRAASAASNRLRIQAKLGERIEIDIWSKFVRLSVFSGVTTVTRLSIGPVRDDPGLLAMCQAAGMETMAVTRASGLPVPAKVLGEATTMASRTLPPQAKSSMLEDLERGRRLELPWLSGAVVRIGDEVSVRQRRIDSCDGARPARGSREICGPPI